MKYDRIDKSEFLKNLSKRYQNLVDDLQIIQNDEKNKKILEDWKLKNSLVFQYYFTDNIFWKSFGKWNQVPTKLYPSKIHREIKGRKKISYYWIEPKKIEHLSPKEVTKSLESKNLFTGIKRIRISVEDSNLLIKGYDEGVIPIVKKDAISIKEIKRKIKENYEPRTKDGIKELRKKIDEDSRNKKIREVMNSKKVLKLEQKINDLLSSYDSKIVQLQPYIHPTSSRKETHYNE